MKYKGIEEAVEVWSIDPPRKMTTCRLAVGAHGLPVLMNAFPPTQVWDFPAAWSLRATGETGILLGTWGMIADLRREIAEAQREVEEAEKEANKDDMIAEHKAEWNRGRV